MTRSAMDHPMYAAVTTAARARATALERGSMVWMASRRAKSGRGACRWPRRRMEVVTMTAMRREETRAHASDSRMMGNWEARRMQKRAKVKIDMVVIGRRPMVRSWNREFLTNWCGLKI